jgi:hypothetical protein
VQNVAAASVEDWTGEPQLNPSTIVMKRHAGEPLPVYSLREFLIRHPGVWDKVRQFREGRAREPSKWPQWCYLPDAVAAEILYGEGCRLSESDRAAVSVLSALAAWRATQGIYRIHPALRDAVAQTPLTGPLPTELLYRLPEWCVYIEMEGAQWFSKPMQGFYAHLNYDRDRGRTELSLMIDSDYRFVPVPLPLKMGETLEASMLGAMAEASRRPGNVLNNAIVSEEVIQESRRRLEPFVSLVLYLCSQTAEYRDAKGGMARQPAIPQPQRTRHGVKEFPASTPRVWEVSYRLGDLLLRARAPSDAPASGTHASPRPHVRRAHWHTYLKGPRAQEQERVLRWLPPIAVGVEDLDELIPVVRDVEPKQE